MKLINRKSLLWSLTALVFLSACSGGSGGAKKAVEQYLGALQGGDFATLYELNATTQKKVALIYRGAEETREAALKKNFEKYKAMFAEAEADSRLWSEKFLFPSDATFTVKVAVEDDKEQGTARFKDRKIAVAEIKVTYASKEKAPDLGSGKLKTAVFTSNFINGYDVVKGIKRKDEIKISEWLFKSIRVKKGEVTTW
ncbi:MAG: hypothetical protein IMF07_04505 [Proteobacteria bacterium]|nr:hypothetical protein [Pseudomonadota bacterium]